MADRLTLAVEPGGKDSRRLSALDRPLLYVNHTAYPRSTKVLTSSAPTPLDPPVIRTVFMDPLLSDY